MTLRIGIGVYSVTAMRSFSSAPGRAWTVTSYFFSSITFLLSSFFASRILMFSPENYLIRIILLTIIIRMDQRIPFPGDLI